MIDPKNLEKAGELFTIEELHRLGLQVVLQRKGVEDPVTFLKEHDVAYVPMFRADVGMAITITNVKPKPKPKKSGAPPARTDTDA